MGKGFLEVSRTSWLQAIKKSGDNIWPMDLQER